MSTYVAIRTMEATVSGSFIPPSSVSSLSNLIKDEREMESAIQEECVVWGWVGLGCTVLTEQFGQMDGQATLCQHCLT